MAGSRLLKAGCAKEDMPGYMQKSLAQTMTYKGAYLLPFAPPRSNIANIKRDQPGGRKLHALPTLPPTLWKLQGRNLTVL